MNLTWIFAFAIIAVIGWIAYRYNERRKVKNLGSKPPNRPAA